jgi:hypothetical protein
VCKVSDIISKYVNTEICCEYLTLLERIVYGDTRDFRYNYSLGSSSLAILKRVYVIARSVRVVEHSIGVKAKTAKELVSDK